MAERDDQQPTPPNGATPGNGGADEAAQAALRAAQEAIASLQTDVNQAASAAKPDSGDAAPAAAPYELPVFSGGLEPSMPKGIDLLSDVNLNVKIELGRTKMLVEDVLKLSEGAVVELDKLAGDPVDVYVNDRHIAKGEVLVLNDNFCVRIHEIVKQEAPVGPAQRAG